MDTPGIGENEFLENYLMEYIRTRQILGFMYIIMTDNALGIAEDRVGVANGAFLDVFTRLRCSGL